MCIYSKNACHYLLNKWMLICLVTAALIMCICSLHSAGKRTIYLSRLQEVVDFG